MVDCILTHLLKISQLATQCVGIDIFLLQEIDVCILNCFSRRRDLEGEYYHMHLLTHDIDNFSVF